MSHYLILGGTGGIGGALARRLCTNGHSVHITGRDPERLEKTSNDIGCAGSELDVLNDDIMDRLGEIVEEASGENGLDGLAYCIGSIDLLPIRSAKISHFETAYRLNLIGAAMAIQSAQRSLSDAEGAVLLFSTVAASQGFANHSVIASAKSGVEAMTRSLAAELAPKIRVNAIAPSLVNTSLADPLVRNEQMARGIAAMHAIPRLGQPDDIAALGEFLLSDAATWITGQIMAVDGGRSSVRHKG